MKHIEWIALLVVSSLLAFSASCQLQKFKHSPLRAASDANRFLSALYFERDYSKALELADPILSQSATKENLEVMVDELKQQKGEVREFKADSYLMVQGRGMELFYVGHWQRGTSYHRLVLSGDADSGYRVSGIWYKDEPYPDQALRHRFSEEIVVR